jgi:hypothetical protein
MVTSGKPSRAVCNPAVETDENDAERTDTLNIGAD